LLINFKLWCNIVELNGDVLLLNYEGFTCCWINYYLLNGVLSVECV